MPSVLDRAVLDRIDEAFEFPIPAYTQRLTMMKMFMDRYIRTQTKRGKGIVVDEQIDDAYIEGVVARTEGFSGRQLAKLALAMQSAVFGTGTTKRQPLCAGGAPPRGMWARRSTSLPLPPSSPPPVHPSPPTSPDPTAGVP